MQESKTNRIFIGRVECVWYLQRRGEDITRWLETYKSGGGISGRCYPGGPGQCDRGG